MTVPYALRLLPHQGEPSIPPDARQQIYVLKELNLESAVRVYVNICCYCFSTLK